MPGGGRGAGFVGAHGPVQYMLPSPARPPAAEAESAIKLRQATELKIQETEAGLRRLLLLHTVLTNIDLSSPVPATPSPPPMVVDGDDADDDRWVTSPQSPGPKPSAAALRAVPPPRLVLPSGAGPAAAAALAGHVQVELTGGSARQQKKRAADDDDAGDGDGEADLGGGGAMMQDGAAEGPGGSMQMVSPAAAAAAKLHPGSPDLGFGEASGIFGGPSAGGGGAIAAAVDVATVAIGSPMKKRKTFALIPSSSMPAAARLAMPAVTDARDRAAGLS